MKLSIKRIFAMSLTMASLIVAGTFVYYYLAGASVFPDGLIQTNGRLEGDKVIIASKVPGRIVTLRAQEGDVITAGQVMAQLDDETARSRVAQARAAWEMAKAHVESTRSALNVLRQQVPTNIATAEAGVRAAEAVLEKSRAAEGQAHRDAQRFHTLAEAKTVDAKTAEQAELAWKVADRELEGARAGLLQAQQALRDARLGPARINTLEAELAASEAAVREAEARLAEAQTALNDLTVVSPAAGTVTTRFADLGEVVNVGMPLFELVDLDNLYLKAYIPEVKIGKVRLGLPAQIYTDVFPDQPFPAKVRYIAARAEFTPKEVQTPDERTKLVYAMKLYLDKNPDHSLTPGLPADAVIRWQEDAPWVKPRW
jgi:HlyD family secretion protein